MAPTRKGASNPTSTKSFTQLTKPQLLVLAARLGIEVDAQQTVPTIRDTLRPAVEQAQEDGAVHAGFERIFPRRQTTPGGGNEDEEDDDEEEEWGGITTQPGNGRSSAHGSAGNPQESISRRHPANGNTRRTAASNSVRVTRLPPAQRRPYSRITRFAEPGSLAAHAREQVARHSRSNDAVHRQSTESNQGENLVPITSDVEQIGHMQLSNRPRAGCISF
jgi:hypothetical protein